MKKALFIFMAFALIAPMVFADTYGNEAAVDVSGNATLTWGYNLESEAHGFLNEAEWNISIPLLAEQDFANQSEGDNYGVITLKGLSATVATGEDPWGGTNDDGDKVGPISFGGDVEAKLVFGDVYATVYNKPSFKADYANIFDALVEDSLNAFIDSAAGEKEFEGWGSKIGFANDDIDIGVKVGSKIAKNADGDDDGTYNTTKDDSKYAFGVDASITAIENVAIDATFNYATWEAGDGEDGIMNLGVKVEATPIEDLTVTVGFDAGKDGKADLAWDASLSAEYQFVSAGLYVEDKWGKDEDGKDVLDMAAWVQVADEGDLVENLDASLAFAAYHFLSSMKDDEGKAMPLPMGLAAELAYKVEMNDVNYLKPFVNFWMGNYYHKNAFTSKDTAKFANAFEIGAEYGLFSNTTVTASFAKGSTNDDDSLKGIIGTDSADDKGMFKVAVKVAY